LNRWSYQRNSIPIPKLMWCAVGELACLLRRETLLQLNLSPATPLGRSAADRPSAQN